MSARHATGTSVEPCLGRGAGVAWVAIGVLDLVVVALLALLDSVDVRTQHGLDHLAFGRPLNWVLQQQARDPSFPYVASMGSPWEDPTTVAWLPLVMDVVVVGLVVAGMWRLSRALRRPAGRAGRCGAGAGSAPGRVGGRRRR